MNSYKTLVAWKYAHEALLATFRATDDAYHPRKIGIFVQIRRAVTSIEANIVEGYALNTPALFRRHLRIAVGSAAEAETALAIRSWKVSWEPENTAHGALRTRVHRTPH